MEILFDKSFYKSLDKLKENRLKLEVLAFIEIVKQAKTISEVPNIKKLKGFKDYYRFKFSAYRIGFQSKNNIVTLITIQHRKEIYRKFP